MQKVLTFLVESGIITCSPHERRELKWQSAFALHACAEIGVFRHLTDIATIVMRAITTEGSEGL